MILEIGIVLFLIIALLGSKLSSFFVLF